MTEQVKKFICRETSMPLIDGLAGTGLSRKKAKQILDTRNVFVNGKRVWMAKHLIKNGDTVSFPDPGEAFSREEQPLHLLYDHEGVRVYNKPPGLETTGDKGLEARIPSRPRRWMPVHRLDRDTSGCVIFTDSREIFEGLKQQFKKQEVDKLYETIVIGALEEPLTLDAHLDGRPAQSQATPLATSREYTWLQVHIATGRKHQIRRHLAEAGFPVLGDALYASRHRHTAFQQTVARQMLHARTISFIHPVSGKITSVTAPRPEDFTAMLKETRLLKNESPRR